MSKNGFQIQQNLPIFLRSSTLNMKIRPGIKLLKEIEGYGDPILKGDRFEAVYKYYYNKGEPILFDTFWHKPIPEIQTVDGKDVIGWLKIETFKSNTVYQHGGWLERQSEIAPGLYYSLLGMKTMGYRFVAIAPHFMSDSWADGKLVKKGSVIKVEIFLMRIFPKTVAPK
ncbi:MAG: hypothetical protein ACXWDN_16470 [Limisphaerales bacterium]